MLCALAILFLLIASTRADSTAPVNTSGAAGRPYDDKRVIASIVPSIVNVAGESASEDTIVAPHSEDGSVAEPTIPIPATEFHEDGSIDERMNERPISLLSTTPLRFFFLVLPLHFLHRIQCDYFMDKNIR